MKKSIIIILLYLLTNTLFAQINLVPNGDFEIYSALPTQADQSYLAIGWNNVNGQYNFTTGSPDYINTLGISNNWLLFLGSIPITPYSGNGQMGFLSYVPDGLWREYISIKLISSMIPSHHYKVSFYLTNGTCMGINSKGTNNIGIHFSTNPLNQAIHEVIPVVPQIKIDTIIYSCYNWDYFCFNFTPSNTFKYITIGNFFDDANTLVSTFGSYGAYYFIDKIEVIPLFDILGDSVICKGNSTSLRMYGDSIANWVDSQQPATIIATDSIITITPTTTTTYLAYSNTDTVSYTVHVVAPPIINLGNDTTLCEGQTIILNATNPYSTYFWQDSSTNATYIVNQAGSYWVRAIIDSNCFATDSIHVLYNPTPTTPTISQNGNILSSSSATGNQWFLNGQAIPGDTNQSYTVPLPITSTSCYSVTITNIYGCSATSDTICFVPLGISELMKNKGICVYPNPASDRLNLQYRDAIEGGYVIDVYNYLGKKVISEKVSQTEAEHQLNTTSLNNGVYIYNITTTTNIFKGKFIILK